MDDSDWATKHEELHNNAALAVRKPVLAITGFCHNCFSVVSGHFCDADCRDDYEKIQAANLRSGHAV